MNHIGNFLQYLSDSKENQPEVQEPVCVSLNEYILNDMDHSKKQHNRLKENSRFGLYFTTKEPSFEEKDVQEDATSILTNELQSIDNILNSLPKEVNADASGAVLEQSLSTMKEDLYHLLSICKSTIHKVETLQTSLCHTLEEKTAAIAEAALEKSLEAQRKISEIEIPNVSIPYSLGNLQKVASIKQERCICTAETDSDEVFENEAKVTLFSTSFNEAENLVEEAYQNKPYIAPKESIRFYNDSNQELSEADSIPIPLQKPTGFGKLSKAYDVAKRFSNKECNPVARTEEQCDSINSMHNNTTNIIDLLLLLKKNSKKENAETMDSTFQETFENNMRRHGTFKRAFQLSVSC